MQTPSSHPDELQFATYLDDRLEAAARDVFEAHLATCANCREALIELRHTLQQSITPLPDGWHRYADPIADFQTTRSTVETSRHFMWALAAGIAGLALVIGWWAQHQPKENSPVSVTYRSPSVEFGIVEPAPGAVLRGSAVDFRWTPADGADQYVLSIVDSVGLPVAEQRTEATTTATRWASPTSAANGSYVWSVRALRLGRVIAESRPASFELQR